MASIELNGDTYTLAPLDRAGTVIRRLDDKKFTERFSQGQQTLSDIDGYVPLRWPNLSLGLGRYRIDSDSATNPDEYRRFWDSNGVDTRWADTCGYLPILEENSTDGTSTAVVRGSSPFKGDIYTLWEMGTSTDLGVGKYTGSSTSWSAAFATALDGSATLVGLDIMGNKTHLLVLYAVNNDIEIRRSSDAGTWSSPTTQLAANQLGTVTANEDIDAGLLSAVGGEAVVAVWHEVNGTITFFSSTDAGDNWASEGVNIPSGNGPQGIAVMGGIDGEDKLYVGTREGLFEVDTAPSTWIARLIFPMVSSTDNCRRMTVHSDGALWFAQGVDDDSSLMVYRMFVSNGQRTIERVPNDFSLGDGVIAEKAGPIRWMESAQGQMWISVGGGKAGRNAWLGCHNGKGWHVMHRHGTADQKIEWIGASGDDDDTPRLHYAVRTATGNSDTVFLGQPFVNPRSGVSIKRESSAFVDLPYVDAGFALDTKNWGRIGINAEDLSAANTGEYINVDRGITSDLGALAAQNTTDVGDFLSGISRITLGTNGVGVAGLVIGLRVNLHRDVTTNTDTPTWKDAQIDAIVKITATNRYEFMVDLAATAAQQDRQTAEVLADLNTARTSSVLVPLTYADMGTDYVDVLDVVYSEIIVGSDMEAADPNARRTGTARVVVSEAL
jgi:hypothetical protein